MLQEVINWDPRTHKGQPLNARSNIYSLKSISRTLATMNGSLTMVPTQAAFEAANTAAPQDSESDLDAAVTIHSVAREVWSLNRRPETSCRISDHETSVFSAMCRAS